MFTDSLLVSLHLSTVFQWINTDDDDDFDDDFVTYCENLFFFDHMYTSIPQCNSGTEPAESYLAPSVNEGNSVKSLTSLPCT